MAVYSQTVEVTLYLTTLSCVSFEVARQEADHDPSYLSSSVVAINQYLAEEMRHLS
jgi:hypothetical protein